MLSSTAARPTIRDKLGRALFPGLGKRICAATSARDAQSLEAGQSEILVENSDGIAGNHVLRSRDGVRRHWNDAGQRFKLNDTKCIGPTRKREHVCSRKVGRQGFPLQLTDEMGIRKATLQDPALSTALMGQQRAPRWWLSGRSEDGTYCKIVVIWRPSAFDLVGGTSGHRAAILRSETRP